MSESVPLQENQESIIERWRKSNPFEQERLDILKQVIEEGKRCCWDYASLHLQPTGPHVLACRGASRSALTERELREWSKQAKTTCHPLMRIEKHG